MSYPTPLGPWFVVQRLARGVTAPPGVEYITGVEYYTRDGEGLDVWTQNPVDALLFMSLHEAGRVASAETAEVRALSSRDDAKEFGRS